MRFTKDEFEQAMTALEIMSREEKNILQAMYIRSDWVCDNWIWEYYKLIKQMCDLESNTEDDLSYFVFELDFGKKWKPGMVTDANGKDIPLLTIDNLWNLLIEEQ